MLIPLETIRKVQLPQRELQVLTCAAKGMADKQIATELGISPDTVGTYWRRILLRFGASSRTEVVAHFSASEALDKINEAVSERDLMLSEIEMRTKAQASELAYRNLLEAITEASLDFISGSLTSRGAFDGILDRVLQLTHSEYGFIGEVLFDDENMPYLKTHSMTNISWDVATQALYEKHLAQGLEFRNLKTLFGEVLTTGGTVISNDPESDSRAGGRPGGHPPMTAFLGIPVYSGADMVGMIGLANRPGGYDGEIVHYLGPIVATTGRFIVEYRSARARKEAEVQLSAFKRQMVLLMGCLRSAVLFEDRNRRVQFCNDAFCQLFNVNAKPQDLIGVDCSQAATQAAGLFADPDRFVTRVAELTQAREAVLGEWIDMADGRVLSRDFVPVETEDGSYGFIWQYQDVSSKARENQLLDGILNASMDAVIMIDSDGSVVYWNDRATEMFGFSRTEALGVMLADLIVPDEMREAHRMAVQRFVTLGRGNLVNTRVEITAMHQDGCQIPVELTITPLRLESGLSFAAFIRRR